MNKEAKLALTDAEVAMIASRANTKFDAFALEMSNRIGQTMITKISAEFSTETVSPAPRK